MVCYWLVLWGPCFFFLTMLHIWWFLWFVAAVFENTRTCVRNILNQGENVFPLQGEEERIVLYVLCYYCWFYWVHCFHFLWHTKMVRVFCENGVCFSEVLAASCFQYSLVLWLRVFFSHSNCCRICAKAIRKKVLLSKKGNHSGMQLKCKEADRDDSLLYFYIE